MELRAHVIYSPRGTGLPVGYWRTASGMEIIPRRKLLRSLWRNEIHAG
jgi:hypothetical protein